MLILVAVRHEAIPTLVGALGARARVDVARSWDAVAALMDATRPDLVVVDPALEGRPRAVSVERLRARHPTIPMLLYTAFDAAVVPTLLRLGALGIDEVLLRGIDDHRERIVAAVDRVAWQRRAQDIAAELAGTLTELPARVRDMLRTGIRARAPWTVTDLARRLGVDRRTCGRVFVRAGLPPPGRVLQLLRLAAGHDLLQDGTRTVTDVADLLGYGRPRSFTEHVRRVFGLPPSRFRRLPEAVVRGRIRSCLQPDRASERTA